MADFGLARSFGVVSKPYTQEVRWHAIVRIIKWHVIVYIISLLHLNTVLIEVLFILS